MEIAEFTPLLLKSVIPSQVEGPANCRQFRCRRQLVSRSLDCANDSRCESFSSARDDRVEEDDAGARLFGCRPVAGVLRQSLLTNRQPRLRAVCDLTTERSPAAGSNIFRWGPSRRGRSRQEKSA